MYVLFIGVGRSKFVDALLRVYRGLCVDDRTLVALLLGNFHESFADGCYRPFVFLCLQ
jgi:hypothetical protein